jgi:alkylation response protein AidB-like acyl-CoA dehydrogenase
VTVSWPAPVVEAFHREGVLGMWVPCTLRGGLELGPLPSMDVLEQVSYADASAGWVLMAACLATGTGGAYLGDEAVAELFGQGSPAGDCRTGHAARNGDARRRRIPPHRVMELRLGHQARHAHPHARRRARHR